MTHWHKDPFFQYPVTVFNSSEGPVELPILYFDNSNVQAFFYADYDAVQDILEEHGVTALRIFRTKALVATAFYEYRQTAVGPYNEVGVAAACVPRGTRPPFFPHLAQIQGLDKRRAGFTIMDLPVTTPAAWAAGREIWGYPKFVTDIGFSLTGRNFKGHVTDPDTQTPMVEMAGRMGPGIPGPQLDLLLYSRHQGKLLRTLVNTRGGGRFHLPGSLQLKVSDSDHPMARRLVRMGLDRAKPVGVFASHSLQLRLNAGFPIS